MTLRVPTRFIAATALAAFAMLFAGCATRPTEPVAVKEIGRAHV